MAELKSTRKGALTPHFNIRIILYYIVSAAVIVIDRIAKHLVASNMVPGQSIPVIKNVFYITFVRNQGAAFSILERQWVLLIVVPTIVLIACLVIMFITRKTWSGYVLMSLALICGGGIGNVIDRIYQSYVVDFFDCRFIPFIDFPVFNTADISICAGCILLLIYVIFLEGKKEKVAR